MRKLLVPVVAIGLAAAVVVLALGAASAGAVSPEEAWRRIEGAWTCPEGAAGGCGYPARQVYGPDRTGSWYFAEGGAEADACYRFTVRKAWLDAEGNLYCQVHFHCTRAGTHRAECAGLMKLDAEGTVLEINAIAGIPEQGARADWGYRQLEAIDPGLAAEYPAPGWGWLTGNGWFSVYWIYHRA
jgi:hypothetical protein